MSTDDYPATWEFPRRLAPREYSRAFPVSRETQRSPYSRALPIARILHCPARPALVAADTDGWDQPRTPFVHVSSGHKLREEAIGRLRSTEKLGLLGWVVMVATK